jgi:serine/threonine protein kinase
MERMDPESWLYMEIEGNHPDWSDEAFEGCGFTFRDWVVSYMPATASRFTSGMERPIGAWVVRTLVRSGIKDIEIPYGRSDLERLLGTDSERLAIVNEFLRWQDATFRVEFPVWGSHVDGVRRSQRTPFVTDHDGLGGVPTARGAQGRVIRVRDEDTGEVFAMKTVQDPRVGLRELEALWALNPEVPVTPHSVRLRASYTDHLGATHMVVHPWGLCTLQDLFKRASAQDWWVVSLESSPGLGADLMLGIALALSRGLASLHAAGLKHRDIKPANIMLVPVGNGSSWPPVRPVLCDFGTSSVLDPNEGGPSASTGNRGTRHYWSPQQESGRRSGRKVDVFSMGCVLLEILAFCMGTRAKLNHYAKQGGYSRLFESEKHFRFVSEEPGLIPSEGADEETKAVVRELRDILLPTMSTLEKDRPSSEALARALCERLRGRAAEAVLATVGDSIEEDPTRGLSSSSNDDEEDPTPDWNQPWA